MSLKMRKNPNVTFEISTEFMAEMLTGDEYRINNALLMFYENLLKTTRDSLQTLMIRNSELNKLKLVARKKLLPKITKYKTFMNDYTNEFKSILESLSTKNDLEYNVKQLQSIGHEKRGKRMGKIWQQIESLMRDKIDY